MDIYLWKVECVVCALLLKATGSLSQQDVCGRASLNTKIVGGENAVLGSWPWQVSFQRFGSHFCGGSLITENWVLSAAHCFQSSPASQITVHIGMRSLVGTDTNMQKRSISKIINHQQYDHNTSDNDIALVQLSSSVTFTSYVLPVCLAESTTYFPDGTKVWVTGWGNIAIGVDLPSPQILQEVQVPIVNKSDCEKAYGVNSITDNMICAGFIQGGKDSCQGDSGGPLVVNVNGAWVQGGIVSFGYGCALPKYPGVYTRVSMYENWIQNKITGKQPGFVEFSTANRSSPNLLCLFHSLIIPLYFRIFW